MAKRMTGPRVGDDVWSATRAYNPPKEPHGIITRYFPNDRSYVVVWKGGDIQFFSKDDFNERNPSHSVWIIEEFGEWTRDNYMREGYKIRLPKTSSIT